jgi:GT2 family glycosyltransferase
MTEPWLSVVMPIHNGEAYLADALDSVAAQAPEGIEIVAVDDGSTDATPEILRRYSQTLPIRVVAEGRLGNWVAATNRGLRLATGAFACFLHHDDLWMQGRLAAVRNELDAHPRATLLVHSSWFVDPRGRRIGRWRLPLPAGRDLAPDFVLERLLVQNFIAIPAAVFRREEVLAVGGLDERLWHTADWDLWLNLAARGTVRCIQEPLSAFRVHPTAQTVTRSADSEDYRDQHVAVLSRHLRTWSPRAVIRERVESAGRFSVETNVTLAALAHRQRPELLPLLRRFLSLGPGGWRRYLRDSRILERAGARVRAGIARGSD